jgi:membrane-bound inhibitor of C-type lysozyme
MVAREREQGMGGLVRAGLGMILALAAAAAQAPVNPDVRVVPYGCSDGSTIVAGYPDAQTAIVTWKNHAYTLKRAPGAGGARYAGFGLQWRTEGDRATLTAAQATLACRARPDKGSARV